MIYIYRYIHRSFHLNSYIDQCQELIDALVDRKDLAVYQTAVRSAAGETADWQYEVDDTFVGYVERGTTQYLDRKDALMVGFNYERWLGGIGQRT